MRWHPTVNIVELDLWRFTYEEKAGAGMELAGAERHRRSPEGELAGASESIEPARRKKTSLSNETERNIEAGTGMEPAGAERHRRSP